jgi:hypothetical protein
MQLNFWSRSNFTAVIITFGPCEFSTLVGFLSTSTLGKLMGQVADSGIPNFEPGRKIEGADNS